MHTIYGISDKFLCKNYGISEKFILIFQKQSYLCSMKH